MERTDLLRPEDEVTVKIFGPEDNLLYESHSKDNHRIEEVIKAALSNANLTVNPEDCVFEVSNDTTGVSHKYRINAHGNLKLIV